MKPQAPNKYHAKGSVCHEGHKHPSKREAVRCDELHLMKEAGALYNLTIQPKFLLAPAFVRDGQRYRATYYVGDFHYLTGEWGKAQAVCEDVKSIDRKTGKPITTALFDLKWKEAIRLYPDVTFRIVEG